MKIYEIQINEEDETGIQLISFVGNPAMQVKGIALSEESKPLELALQEDKMLFTSAVIIPDKLILRRDAKTGEEYYIKFSVDQVEKIRNKFFKQGDLKTSNKDHVAEDTVNALLVESWIIENEKMDKAVALGFEGLPAGTLMTTYKVLDEQVWNEIKSGSITGFSLEGLFREMEVQLALEATEEDFDSLLEADLEFDQWIESITSKL